jgi:hypothetical protein
MRRVSSADLVRNFSVHSDAALAEPLMITRNGRASSVTTDSFGRARVQTLRTQVSKGPERRWLASQSAA